MKNRLIVSIVLSIVVLATPLSAFAATQPSYSTYLPANQGKVTLCTSNIQAGGVDAVFVTNTGGGTFRKMTAWAEVYEPLVGWYRVTVKRSVSYGDSLVNLYCYGGFTLDPGDRVRVVATNYYDESSPIYISGSVLFP